MNIKILFILSIKVYFYLCSINETNSTKYILMPFYIEEKSQNINESNADIFIKQYFIKNLIINFNLGSPFQKINGIIQKNNICFELKYENSTYFFINEKYKPKLSSTFSLINKLISRPHQNNKYMNIGNDYISFDDINEKYNLSFLFQITEEESINIENISNSEYYAQIGLNKPLYYSHYDCPNFISEIKEKASLNKYLISFEFISSNKGNLVIGDELFKYNNKKYHESQYISTYSNDDFEIFFDDIILPVDGTNNISFNGTYGYLDFNLGVLIGTKEYKQVIDAIFFNKLIEDKKCQIENVTYNNTHNYYVYSCDEKLNLKLFPKIIFISKKLLYYFDLKYSDLFIKMPNNKYYFLIIFKANNIPKTKDFWILGQPFYKKYTFSINVDEKIIFFYNPNLSKEETTKRKKDNERNYINIKKIIFIIITVIIFVGLLILAFFIGKKMSVERKKRANELKDDNYEYFPETKENNLGIDDNN